LLRFYLSIHSNLIFVKIFIYAPLTKAAPSSCMQCLPAHGGKRQFMVPGGQLMAQTDTSWRQPDWRRHFWGVTMSGMP